jgi:hypothetical protein
MLIKVTIKGSPFKSANDVPHESRKIIEQNNFVNQSLHTIGQQLDRIEEKIISPTFLKSERPLISLPKKRKSLDSKINSQKNIEKFEKKFSDLKIDQDQVNTSEFHQKKTSEFSDTNSISSDFSSPDKLNHMNCSALTKTEKQEDLLLTLISKIENPELKEEYLKKLKKKDANKPSESKISLDETLEKFSKQKSKVATVSDLQHEIRKIKKDIVVLKKDFHKKLIKFGTRILNFKIQKLFSRS